MQQSASFDEETVQRVQELGGRPRRKFYLFPRLQVIERLRSYRWTGLQSFMQELAAFARTTRGEQTPLALGRDGSIYVAETRTKRVVKLRPVR